MIPRDPPVRQPGRGVGITKGLGVGVGAGVGVSVGGMGVGVAWAWERVTVAPLVSAMRWRRLLEKESQWGCSLAAATSSVSETG